MKPLLAAQEIYGGNYSGL